MPLPKRADVCTCTRAFCSICFCIELIDSMAEGGFLDLRRALARIKTNISLYHMQDHITSRKRFGIIDSFS